MLKKSIWIWLLIIPLAVLNGFLRDKVIAPGIGMEYAEPLSGVILCLLILLIVCLFIPRLGKGTKKTFLRIGLVWLFLTVGFEIVLGLALGMSGREILRTYDPRTGNLWLIVVLFTWIVPLLAARLRGLIVTEKPYRKK